MNHLVLEGYRLLIKIDVLLCSRDLHSIHSLVRKSRVATERDTPTYAAQELCHAVDLACVFYLKNVRCLQRSAATTLLLRRYGHRAEMVIGAQLLPFTSHAWVEIDDTVINDKPYMPEIYQILDRC
jgi:Transglutaminase-like superfamily